MESTDYLYAELLRERHEAAIQNLRDENEKYGRIRTAILHFVEDPSINSCGIRSLKRQLDDYLLIISAMQQANNDDMGAYALANLTIDHEDLNGYVVIVKEQHIKLKMHSDAMASLYYHLYRISCQSPFGGSGYLKDIADDYMRESDAHERVIIECTRIIMKYDGIEFATKNLLVTSVQKRQLIADALDTMGKAFESGEYDPYLSEYWRSAFKDLSKCSKCLQELQDLGVTEDQIANMEEKGFSPQEILEMVNQCKTDTDRDFLFALMNKQYETAFRTNPDDLSDEMFDILADYHIHMYHFDSHNRYIMDSEPPYDVNNLKEFEEIEDFNNALLSASDCVYMGHNETLEYKFKYLERMADCTSDKMNKAGDSASDTIPGSSEWNLKMAEYYRAQAAHKLLVSELAACSDLRSTAAFGDGIWDIKIADLNFDVSDDGPHDKGLLEFTIRHSADYGIIRKDYILGRPLRNGEDFSMEFALEDLEKARRDYENADSEALQETLLNLSFAALSVGAPEVTAVFSTVYTLLNDEGEIYGLNESLKKNYAYMGEKPSSLMSNILSELIIGDITGSKKAFAAKVQLADANKRVCQMLYGTGSAASVETDSETLKPGTHFITSTGTSDPGFVYMRNKVEREGLSWVEFGTDEDGNEFTTDYVWEQIKKDKHLSCPDDLEPRVRKMCKFLLKGAPEGLPESIPKGAYFWYEITGHDGVINDYDMEVLVDALQTIEDAGAVHDHISSQFIEKATAFDEGTLVEN